MKPLSSQKRVAILQSNYIPWKGYFDIIHDVDLFVFYDDVQFTTSDWRNRNLIKTHKGKQWLTIPVGKNKKRRICDVKLSDGRWATDHWKTLELNYRAAPYFQAYRPFLEDVYIQRHWDKLSTLNQYLVKKISTECLNISTEFADSREFALSGRKADRLLDLLEKTNASEYVSGPAAKSYIDEDAFLSKGIPVQWKRYDDYPKYPQLFPPFIHDVTILDLLFNLGPQAPWYIWGHRDSSGGGP